MLAKQYKNYKIYSPITTPIKALQKYKFIKSLLVYNCKIFCQDVAHHMYIYIKTLVFKEKRYNIGISEKELQYFTEKYQKTTGLGKMYLLSKILKRLFDVPGRPVISNCGTPTEKVTEFLDHHLKPVMQEGESYIKDTVDFLNKIKNINAIPENPILVTADVVGLYPSLPPWCT